MWEESIIFLIIYLGLFFIIPDNIRIRLFTDKYIVLTATVFVFILCLSIYGIYKNKQISETFVGVGDLCGPPDNMKRCGSDNPDLVYCLINTKTLPTSDFDQSVVFNIYGRYVRISRSNTNLLLNQVIVLNAAGENIARSKSTSVSSTKSGAAASSVVVDGTTTPRSRSQSWESNTSASTEYWQVDLGAIHMITTVRIIGCSDYGDTINIREKSTLDTVKGTQILVLKETSETATTGTCVASPTIIYPIGTTSDEQQQIGPLILDGMNGVLALAVLRGIKSSTATALTVYGLTDSQAAAAYNALYLENLNMRKSGWRFSASWNANSNTLNLLNGPSPNVNMTIRSATGIPSGTKVTSVSGNTITLNANTTSAQSSAFVELNGDIDDNTLFSLSNPIRSMTTMSSITYDKSAALQTFMSQNKKDILTLSSSGVPVVNSSGEVVKIRDNGAAEALKVIMSVTKPKAADPSAGNSYKTTSVSSKDGVAGYSLSSAPNVSSWSSDIKSKIPQQTTSINIEQAAPILVTPETTDEDIRKKSSMMWFKNCGDGGCSPGGSGTIATSQSLPLSTMKTAATTTQSEKGYRLPEQRREEVSTQNLPKDASGAAMPNAVIGKEVFWLGFTDTSKNYSTQQTAGQACTDAGADRLATYAEINAAFIAGAQWCSPGWVSDTTTVKYYPMQEIKSNCSTAKGLQQKATTTAGAVCYGYKPSFTRTPDATKPFPKPFFESINETVNNQLVESTKASVWNAKSIDIISSSACGMIEGVQAVKKLCDGQNICLKPGLSCPRACPTGSSYDGSENKCDDTTDDNIALQTTGVRGTALANARKYKLPSVMPEGTLFRIGFTNANKFATLSRVTDWLGTFKYNQLVQGTKSNDLNQAFYLEKRTDYPGSVFIRSKLDNGYVSANRPYGWNGYGNEPPLMTKTQNVGNESRLNTDHRGNPDFGAAQTYFFIDDRGNGWSKISIYYSDGSKGGLWDVRGNVPTDGADIILYRDNGQGNQSVFFEYLELNDAGTGTQEYGTRELQTAWAQVPMLNYSGTMSGNWIANPPPQVTRNGVAVTVPAFDNFKIYNGGDVILLNNIVYRLRERIGGAGYNPIDHSWLWEVDTSYSMRSDIKKRIQRIAYTNSTDKKEIEERRNIVFLMQDGEHVKMVQNDYLGTGKYYTGDISEYEPSEWPNYTSVGTTLEDGNYRVDLTPGTSFVTDTSWTPWWRAIDNANLQLPFPWLTQTITVGRKGRYIKIRPSTSFGDGYMHFSQIVVTDLRGNNIAKDKSVAATSTYGDGKGPSVVVDGTLSPRAWPNVWHIANVGRETEYLLIDLGKIHHIASITYYGRSDCCTNRTTGLRFEITTGRATTWRSQ